MTTVDDEIKIQVLTGLNCGEKPDAIAHRLGLSIRAVKELSKARHCLREARIPVEGEGQILHAVGVLARWDQRPQRQEDARRRDAARKAVDNALARYGLKRPAAPIILPGTAPARASWRRKKARVTS